MAEMKRVRLADMRPDPKNPRKDFNGIDELAASFEFTPDRPGEPVNPPIVVKDGNVYRIVDGERRYRAMCKYGTADNACLCVVFDDFGAASSVAAMMATDDKEQLTDRERSIGMQQMLILGVPDETADRMSRSKPGSAKRLRGVIAGKDEPVQLDMDTLFKVSEINDDGKRSELIGLIDDNAEQWGSDFRNKLSFYQQEQDRLSTREMFIDALEDAGIYPAECKPGDGWKVHCYVYRVDQVNERIEHVESLGAEYCVIVPQLRYPDEDKSWWGDVYPVIYVKMSDDELSKAESETLEKKRMKAFWDDFTSSKVRRIEYIVGIIKDGSISDGANNRRMADLRDWICDQVEAFYKNHWYAFVDADLDGIVDKPNFVKISCFEEWAIPIYTADVEPLSSLLPSICLNDYKPDANSLCKAMWSDYLEVLVKSGYEPCEVEKVVIEKCSGSAYEKWLEELQIVVQG